MTINYAKVAENAKRLLDAHGRDVTLRQVSRTPEDNDKPWRGSATPRATAEVVFEHTIKAVFVEPYSLIRYGFTGLTEDEIRRVSVVVISSGKDVTDLGFDAMMVDELVDDQASVIYKVELVRELSPGSVPLMYVWGARR